MSVAVSFIIPCFNHGSFLSGAIGSIRAIRSIETEIIIVDDGSTDPETISILELLANDPTLRVLHQPNAGPGAARNNGIRYARGTYIIPLDADDRIRAEYPEAAVALMDAEPGLSVVYADFQQFGEAQERMRYRSFCMQDLLLGNSIGAAAVYRKAAWEAAGGYDEALRNGLGWEDWELWLHFAALGLQFRHLDLIGYDYYYHAGSRERKFLGDKNKINNIIAYFEQKHPQLFAPGALHRHLIAQFRRQPLGMFGKLLLAVFFPGRYEKLVAQGKIRRYLY